MSAPENSLTCNLTVLTVDCTGCAIEVSLDGYSMALFLNDEVVGFVANNNVKFDARKYFSESE